MERGYCTIFVESTALFVADRSDNYGLSNVVYTVDGGNFA